MGQLFSSKGPFRKAGCQQKQMKTILTYSTACCASRVPSGAQMQDSGRPYYLLKGEKDTVPSRARKRLRTWQQKVRDTPPPLPYSPYILLFFNHNIRLRVHIVVGGQTFSTRKHYSRWQATVRQCRTLLRLRRTPPSPLSLDFGNPDTIVTTATLLACYRMWIVFV